MTDRYTAFDLNAPKLPHWIKKEALGSGGFPYEDTLKKSDYKEALIRLQLELVKLQAHMLDKGTRIMIVLEGRDTAGKSSLIGAYSDHLNPRNVISVALPKPSDRERTQWYFQRYVDYFPAAGETVLFDRSWYNRSGVEPVMGFSTPEQTDAFLDEAPNFEHMIVRDGIHVFKFWLSLGREMQLMRFWERQHNPLKQWKLSPIDLKAITLWDDYTAAAERTLTATDSAHAPWTVVESNDQRRARLAVIQVVLSRLDYSGKDEDAIGTIDRKIAMSAATFLGKQRVVGA